jgi:hypothetical protein
MSRSPQSIPSVSVNYAQDGSSTKSASLGMRPMQERAWVPAEQEGMILALRRAKSDVGAMTFDLLTIDPAKRWKFEDYDSGKVWSISGQEIREKGFEIAVPNRRDSRLIFYSVDPTSQPAGQH